MNSFGLRKNPFAMLNEFREFARTMTPEEAEKRVREMVRSGQIDKRTFEEVKSRAMAFQKFIGGK